MFYFVRVYKAGARAWWSCISNDENGKSAEKVERRYFAVFIIVIKKCMSLLWLTRNFLEIHTLRNFYFVNVQPLCNFSLRKLHFVVDLVCSKWSPKHESFTQASALSFEICKVFSCFMFTFLCVYVSSDVPNMLSYIEKSVNEAIDPRSKTTGVMSTSFVPPPPHQQVISSVGRSFNTPAERVCTKSLNKFKPEPNLLFFY